MEQQMTVNDAISLLDKATSALKLDRSEHSYVIAALQIFQKLEADHQSALNQIESLKKQIEGNVPSKLAAEPESKSWSPSHLRKSEV